MNRPTLYVLVVLRLLFSWIFLWTFFDKLFGLGFATEPGRAWLAGASPTSGFLLNATGGPLAELFRSLAGQPVVDWLFMLGLLFVGLALLLGIAVRPASLAGSSMMALIYLASALPPENNPLIDEHIIYIAVFILLAVAIENTGILGFGCWWKNLKLVKRYRWLA